jgi:hypothetical protein
LKHNYYNCFLNVRLFGFIAGYQTHKIQTQDPVNIKAALPMGKLHDQMKDVGYSGHPLELYLVRLLFCLFAEDTGIFERQQLQEYIEQRTGEDGSDPDTSSFIRIFHKHCNVAIFSLLTAFLFSITRKQFY